MAMEPENAACNVLVLYLRDCHESLIGIIAGRVKDRVHKPVIVFTDASDNTYKGSGVLSKRILCLKSLLG